MIHSRVTDNQASYNTELVDLVAQLDDMKSATFNAQPLFELEHSINYDEDGDADLTLSAAEFALAVKGLNGASDFTALTVDTIDRALQNVANLRAQNGSEARTGYNLLPSHSLCRSTT